MTKKKKIILGIAALAIIALSAITYGVVNDLNQEEKLKKEIDYLDEITSNEKYDKKEINKILNRVVTKGEYRKVETAYKNYMTDCFNIICEMKAVMEDERLVKVLSDENYQKDGPDFVETKNFLAKAKIILSEDLNKLQEYFTEEKAMSYLDKNIDDYYKDYYKKEVIGEVDNINDDKTIENSINDLVSLITDEEAIINFLINNKGNWEIDNNEIVFYTNSLTDQYNNLLSKITNEE